MVEPLLAFAGPGLNPQREGKDCFTNGFLHNARKSTCHAIAALEIFSAQRRGDTVNYNRRMQTWERTSVLIAWGVQRPGIGLRIVSTCYRWHWPVMLSLGED